MNKRGIETGLDLRAQSMPFLQQHFGKAGAYYYWIARGVEWRTAEWLATGTKMRSRP
jgi:DNA polymerase-4